MRRIIFACVAVTSLSFEACDMGLSPPVDVTHFPELWEEEATSPRGPTPTRSNPTLAATEPTRAHDERNETSLQRPVQPTALRHGKSRAGEGNEANHRPAQATTREDLRATDKDQDEFCDASDCDDDNPCTTGVCPSSEGSCTTTSVDNGLPCHGPGVCQDGTCWYPSCEPAWCEDGNPCTADDCAEDHETLCTHTAINEGLPCDEYRVCVGGHCVGPPVCTPGDRAYCHWMGSCASDGSGCICDAPDHYFGSERCEHWHQTTEQVPWWGVCAPGDQETCNWKGTCDEAGLYCDCHDVWWKGDNCDIPASDCPGYGWYPNDHWTPDHPHFANADQVCQNRGRCIHGPQAPICECDLGYTGENCERLCPLWRVLEPESPQRVDLAGEGDELQFSDTLATTLDAFVPLCQAHCGEDPDCAGFFIAFDDMDQPTRCVMKDHDGMMATSGMLGYLYLSHCELSSCIEDVVNCVSCEPGYELSGNALCVDIDECSQPLQPCGTDALCLNKDGSVECLCHGVVIAAGQPCSPCPPGSSEDPLSTECVSCPAGSFKNEEGPNACTAWSTCPADHYLSIAGTPISDVVCTPCSAPPPGQFTLSPCYPGDSTLGITGQDTEHAPCSAPLPGHFVLTPCQSGDQHTVGADTSMTSCTPPHEGSFVSAVCLAGGLNAGVDSVVVPCTTPNQGEFVQSPCLAGDPSSLGQDTTISPCQAPDVLEYVTVPCASGAPNAVGSDTNTQSCSTPEPGQFVSTTCVSGDQGETGQDTSMLSCLQPQPGQYVTETCLSGAPLVPGQNTGVSACSSCPKNTYIGSSCTSGDASNEGSQTLCYACPRHSSSPEASSRIEDCVCDAGYLRQGTGSATQCVPHCLSTTPYQSVGQGWCVSETTDDTGNGYWRAVDAESCELQCTSDVNCYAYTINAGENGCLIYTNGSEAPTGWFWIPGTVNQLGNIVGSGTHNGSCMVKQAPSSDCECPKSGCVTMPTMTLVSAGSFIMGCRVPRDTIDDDCESIMMPPHEVSLSRDLWAMQTEVTEALYVAVTGQTSAHSQCGPECPVINVTWREALSFANNLSLIDGLTPCYDPSKGTISDPAAQGNPYACEGYRLPTEAEWEYLARGGTGDAYAGSDIIADVAWYADTSNATRHPACTKAPNAYGLCDMSGNVAEWTADALFAYSSDAQVDPYTSGDTARRVIRGGSWASEPSQTRSAARSTHDPNAQTPTLGFRLVRSLP